MPDRTLILDSDCVTWPSAFANSPADCAVSKVRGLMERLQADRAICCFGCQRDACFRRALSASYKSKPRQEPEGLPDARRGLRDAFPSRELPTLEADDVVGILATHPDVSGERVIVSSDKDLMTVPGLHFNPLKPADGVTEVSEREAALNHALQTLTGDSGDGYAGVPGIGLVKARQILYGASPRVWWAQILLAFRRAGLTDADALLQARLARILRATDYDMAAGRVRLWEPPTGMTNQQRAAVPAGGAA